MQQTTISNFAAFSKITYKAYFMRIVCWQTILMEYHTLFFFERCCKICNLLQMWLALYGLIWYLWSILILCSKKVYQKLYLQKIVYFSIMKLIRRLRLFCLFWFFTSQSTIFQSCQDGFSWTSTKQRIKHLAQGHNAVPLVRLEPTTPLSRAKHSATEPLHSSIDGYVFVGLCHNEHYNFRTLVKSA